MMNYSMRPQDIVALLKIITFKGKNWMNKDLASELYLSPAEISNSLQRSIVSGLLDADHGKVRVQALTEFLIYGLPYIFPQKPGGMAKGLPTAHSHDFFKDKIISHDLFVWPDAESNYRGFSVQPLYPGAVKAARKDPELYLYLSLIDVLRMGKAREKNIAIEKLKQKFNESPY